MESHLVQPEPLWAHVSQLILWSFLTWHGGGLIVHLHYHCEYDSR